VDLPRALDLLVATYDSTASATTSASLYDLTSPSPLEEHTYTIHHYPPRSPFLQLTALTRETNHQLTLTTAISPSWYSDNRPFLTYEVKVAATAQDLADFWSSLPTLRLLQSSQPAHFGYRQPATTLQDLLVTEPVTDEEFYLAVGLRDAAWYSPLPSTIWHCQSSTCTAHPFPAPSHHLRFTHLTTLPSGQAQITINNSSDAVTTDLNNFIITTGEEPLATITSLNADTNFDLTDQGETLLRPGDDLRVILPSLPDSSGLLTLFTTWSAIYAQARYQQLSTYPTSYVFTQLSATLTADPTTGAHL
jgi:hypothetical protein